MNNDKLDDFIKENQATIYDECHSASSDHRIKFAMRLGAATHPKKWYSFRPERVLVAAILLFGVFLIHRNSLINSAEEQEENENYVEVVNYYIGGVNNKIDSLMKKAELLDSVSREMVLTDLSKMKEENITMVKKDQRYNIAMFEAVAKEISERQTVALKTMEYMISKNNNTLKYEK